jgi:hypothetical protein
MQLGLPIRSLACSIGVSLLAVFTASAVDFRWTNGYGQGTVIAAIENDNDSYFQVFCPVGDIDTTPGLFVNVRRLNQLTEQQILMQVVVDERNYSFYIQNYQFRAAGRGARESLEQLLSALIGSRSRSFVVEFPKYGFEERFSLSGVRQALGSGRNFVLQGC